MSQSASDREDDLAKNRKRTKNKRLDADFYKEGLTERTNKKKKKNYLDFSNTLDRESDEEERVQTKKKNKGRKKGGSDDDDFMKSKRKNKKRLLDEEHEDRFNGKSKKNKKEN